MYLLSAPYAISVVPPGIARRAARGGYGLTGVPSRGGTAVVAAHNCLLPGCRLRA